MGIIISLVIVNILAAVILIIAGGFLIDYSFSMDTDKSLEERNLGSLYELPVDCSERGDQCVTVESGTLEEKNATAHRLYYLYDSKSTENGLKNLLVAILLIGMLLPTESFYFAQENRMIIVSAQKLSKKKCAPY